jgi:hypothetical protein
MPSSLADFRAKLHQEVTLPEEGLTVLIRRPDVEIFMELGELPLPSSARSLSPNVAAVPDSNRLSLRDINRYAERVIAEGVIDPPFSDARDDQGKPIYSAHYIHASELCKEDKAFLANTLFGLLGLTPEVARAIEAFQSDEVRADDSELGAGVFDVALPGDEVLGS